MAKKQEKISSEQAEIQALKAALKTALEENERLKQKLDCMNELPLNAQRAQFGRSSEKRSYVMGDGAEQMVLFNEAKLEQDPKAAEPTEETFTVAAHARKKKRTIEELAANLPVEEVLLELPEDEQVCTTCGKRLRLIGRKFVRQELRSWLDGRTGCSAIRRKVPIPVRSSTRSLKQPRQTLWIHTSICWP